MRRKEREVTDLKEIEEILAVCKVCRVAMNDEQGIYIVPLNFGYYMEDGALTLFFHGAKKGRKAEILKSGAVNAGFEMDCEHQLVEGGAVGCDYTYKFASIIGQGQAVTITDAEEKEAALNYIMKQQTGKRFEFPVKMLEATMVFKIKADEYTGKRN